MKICKNYNGNLKRKCNRYFAAGLSKHLRPGTNVQNYHNNCYYFWRTNARIATFSHFFFIINIIFFLEKVNKQQDIDNIWTCRLTAVNTNSGQQVKLHVLQILSNWSLPFLVLILTFHTHIWVMKSGGGVWVY